jgi:hypothetical protein
MFPFYRLPRPIRFSFTQFLLLSLFLFIFYWIICSIPIFAKVAIREVSSDLLQDLGLYRRLVLLTVSDLFFIRRTDDYFIVINILIAFLLVKSPKKFVASLLVLALLIPMYKVNIEWSETVSRRQYLRDIVVKNYPTVVFHQIFNRSMLPLDSIKTESDFYAYAESVYKLNRSKLQTAWQISDELELKSMFLLNFVSRIWPYGDPLDPKAPGCALNNRLVGMIPLKAATIETYLKSPIGCCGDYAYMLNTLLTHAGIKNRIVSVPGHVFNEAYFLGRWNSLDANTGLYFHDSWENITFRPYGQKVVVTKFPNHNLIGKYPESFRMNVGSFRAEMLIAAEKRTLEPTY